MRNKSLAAVVTAAIMLSSCAQSAFAKKQERDLGPCAKNISFSAVMKYDGQVHSYMSGWIDKWIEKNQKKHSDVCFNQQPQADLANYMIVLSTSASQVRGVQLVTLTSTSNTSVSGSGSASGSGNATSTSGSSWDFTYNGTVNYDATASTTTTSQALVPYELERSTLYATGYDDQGGVVGAGNHFYVTQEGGNNTAAAVTNTINAFRAINARGRLINGVVETIERSRSSRVRQATSAAVAPAPVAVAPVVAPKPVVAASPTAYSPLPVLAAQPVAEVSLGDVARRAKKHSACLVLAADNSSITCN
jgi:hypothetical protein